MRELTTEPMRHTLDGKPAVTPVPVIPADASPAFAEGLRRRRVAAVLGRCPCGATRRTTELTLAGATQGTLQHMPFDHRADCPAHDELLGAELAAWQTTKGGARRGAQTR